MFPDGGYALQIFALTFLLTFSLISQSVCQRPGPLLRAHQSLLVDQHALTVFYLTMIYSKLHTTL